MIDMKNSVPYSSPDLELIKLNMSADVLAISDPAQPVTPGTGGGSGAGEDPFGDLP